MWGRHYWGGGRRPSGSAGAGGGGGEVGGVVVMFAWLSSQERHVRAYVELYAALGWACLVCHSDFLALFFPDKAAVLADGVLTELVKELKVRPVPVVFASFSGGPKGCTHKALQLLERRCEGQLSLTLPAGFLLVASHLTSTKLRSDYRHRLLSLCSDVGLAAESKSGRSGADLMGPLLPAVGTPYWMAPEVCYLSSYLFVPAELFVRPFGALIYWSTF